MVHRPDHVPAHHLAFIVQRFRDIRIGTSERLLFIEIVYHHNPAVVGDTPDPTISQTVHRVGFQIIRSHLLLVAAVFHYCQYFEDGCTVFLDHLIWPNDDEAARTVHHGSIARIEIPPPQGYSIPTPTAVQALEEPSEDVIQALLEESDAPSHEDTMSMLQTTITGDLLPAASQRVRRQVRGAALRHFADLSPSACQITPSDDVAASSKAGLSSSNQDMTSPPQTMALLGSLNAPDRSLPHEGFSDLLEISNDEAALPKPVTTFTPQSTQSNPKPSATKKAPKRTKTARKSKSLLPAQTSLMSFFSPANKPAVVPGKENRPSYTQNEALDDDCNRPSPHTHKCSADQTAEPPQYSENTGQVPQPRTELPPPRTRWQMDLNVLFEEFSQTDHQEVGPQMPEEVWFIHHVTYPACLAPRMVVLDDIVELWYEDLTAPWAELIQPSDPLAIRIVTPTPAVLLRPRAKVHVILEQASTPQRLAIHFTAAFHGGARRGIMQRVDTAPSHICTQMMMDKYDSTGFATPDHASCTQEA